MAIKKGLLSVIMILLFCATVYGADTMNTDMPEVIASHQWEAINETSGRAFFLSAKGSFAHRHTGSIVAVNSEITIKDEFNGDIYLFCSEAKLTDKANMNGNIYSFSSLIEADKEIDINIITMFIIENLLYEPVITKACTVYDGRMSTFFLLAMFCVIRQVICLVLYGVKPGFFQQGSMLLTEAPQDIIRFGLLTYIVFLSLALIFLMSVAGVIITLVVLIAAFFMTLPGQTSLSISLGVLLTLKLKLKAGPYLCGIMGGILTELILFIPYIGVVASFVFLPILYLGIVMANFINGFFRRRFYETPFDSVNKKEDETDKEAVHKILNSNI